MFSAASATAPHVKAGKLRALAVTSAQPSPLLPGLPTVAASGLPGYEAILPFGMFAPAKTPMTVIDQLNKEVVQALNRPEVRERLAGAGTEAVGSSPEQLAATMKSEISKWGKLIKDAGIRDD
jgi:tripartite-type tricarboxylate transporter receptor subunit TctC